MLRSSSARTPDEGRFWPDTAGRHESPSTAFACLDRVLLLPAWDRSTRCSWITSGRRLCQERNRGPRTLGRCQDDGMADILPFHQRRTPAPDPEPLWREVLGRRLRETREEQG